MSDTTVTPQETLRAATDENALKQGWATLLGTVVAPDTARALVRFRNGKVVTLRPGDKLGTGTIMAVEDGTVMLALAGETRKLTLPGD